MDHPSEETLNCFAAGTGSRDENRAVVAHLLQGCPACARILRSLMEPAKVTQANYEEPLDRFGQGVLQGLESAIDPLTTARDVPSGVFREPPPDHGPRKKH
jgi:hypothetical protein